MNILIHPSLPLDFTAVTAKNEAWTAVHWTDVGPDDATITQVLTYASHHGNIIVSGDLSLLQILNSMTDGLPSILIIRDEISDVGTSVEHASLALEQMESNLLAGALITLTITPDSKSLRELPIGRNSEKTQPPEGANFTEDAFLPESFLSHSEWPQDVRLLGMLCIKINRLSVMRLQDIRVKDDSRALLTALLFAQATTSFEASCLLAGTGMEGEARSQARSCVEAAIVCYAHSFKPELDVIQKLHLGQYVHYRNLLKALQESIDLQEGDPLFSNIQQVVSDSLVQDGAKINLEKIAKTAGIQDIYDALYRYLSAEGGHITWDSLSKIGAHNQSNGQLVGVSIHPRFERIGETLSIAAQCQLVALKGLQIAFPDKDIDDIVAFYLNSLRQLATLP